MIDGHDGSGKTTISRLLAERIGGIAVRPFDDSLGDMIAWLCRRDRYELANLVAREAVNRMFDIHPDHHVLVFDRHWASIFVDVPRSCWSEWLPLPPTVICWVDLDTTIQRLQARNEDVGAIEPHAAYCEAFRRLASEYEVSLLDTSQLTPDEALDRVVSSLGLEVPRQSPASERRQSPSG